LRPDFTRIFLIPLLNDIDEETKVMAKVKSNFSELSKKDTAIALDILQTIYTYGKQ
jgi:hypothetical protein